MEGEDLVELPRTLALDLIRVVDVAPFLDETPWSGLKDELHYERWEAHKEHMREITENLCCHICDEGLAPTEDLMLRLLVMAYEAAPHIQLLDEARAARVARAQEGEGE